MCIGLDKIVFYMSLNKRRLQEIQVCGEKKLQAVNEETFLQHLSILNVTQEEKGGVGKEMEVIHKLCCSDLVGLIKNYRQRIECFPSINTTVLGWISMYSGIHTSGV